MITKKNNQKEQPLVFFVDDDLAICKEVDEFLNNVDLRVKYFTSPVDCINQISEQVCNLLITDYRMPGIDGIELMKAAKSLQPGLPIIIISGYGDIPTAVSVIKEGAVDFIEKPLDLNYFLSKIRSTLQDNCVNNLINISLTKMEHKVLNLILEGKNNKESALILSRSRRTIEFHRGNLMRKLEVDNVVDLTKRAYFLYGKDGYVQEQVYGIR